jgi:hypothetical protein
MPDRKPPAALTPPDLYPDPNRPGFVHVTRENITYSMPERLGASLKTYWVKVHRGYRPSVARWYEELPDQEKKQVLINGKTPTIREEGTDPESFE